MESPIRNREYKIALNFFSLTVQEFSFTVYRKCFQGEERRGIFQNCRKFSLPINVSGDVHDENNRADYWVSFQPLTEFEPCIVQQYFNRYLTQQYLFGLLKEKSSSTLDADLYHIEENNFRKQIAFTLETHPEGEEKVWLEPFFLSVDEKYGFLVDFWFKKKDSVPFSRKVQQLSLSLNQKFQRNGNFYIDRHEKIKLFIRQFREQLFPLSTSTGISLDIEEVLYQQQGETLEVKKYIFGDNKEANSQFLGIKRYGPLELPPETSYKFLFAFRDQDRGYARELLKALQGKAYPHIFSGIEDMFHIPFRNENIEGISLRDYSEASIKQLLTRAMGSGTEKVIPAILLPSKENPEDRNAYYLAKYLFSKKQIPLQFVTLPTLKNREILKWSVSNLGLQIFSKLGGRPWKVKPRNQDCLIIGVGKCHEIKKENNQNRISKFFAYSVLTDSSGLYLDLEVLSETEHESTYINNLKQNLKNIIERYKDRYSKIVIHAPFKIRFLELESIKEMLQEFQEDAIEFVVLKVNMTNKFFGYYPDVNSLVPFESTYLKLSRKEYLVWFEGLQYHNRNTYKLFGGPTHIEFYYESNPLSAEERKAYLQDTINLSGANWRGFNAKSLPISIYYCVIVAEFIREFNKLGYKDFKINNLNPWFL